MSSELINEIEYEKLRDCFVARPREANKGDFGHVGVIGGYRGYLGAVVLSAMGALRVGAGLVSVGTHPSHATLVSVMHPELMSTAIHSVRDLDFFLQKVSVLVIGPGLAQVRWSKKLLNAVLTTEIPKVVDADALNLLPTLKCLPKQAILTPHPGEAARLLGMSTIEHDRLSVVKQLVERYRSLCILKGARTLIADHESISVCLNGNPGMASGGMGDVLAGVIGGLLAQRYSLKDAATLGVCVHAKAGDLAAGKQERGLIASDLFPFLRQCVNP